MCQFIETLRVERGVINNLAYHQKRVNRTLKQWWNTDKAFSLEFLQPLVSNTIELSKLRFVYDDKGIYNLSISPYQRKEIKSLLIVTDNNIDYALKSTNRSHLNKLKAAQDDCDEILIVKHHYLTDTSYTNIALYDGSQWFTPSTPLLRGTMRESLLDCGLIKERDIRVEDLDQYERIALFNAMMKLGEVSIPIECIKK